MIVDAARRLFEDGGYAATAVPSIAAAAGVAVKTVYLAFESKAGLLRSLWEDIQAKLLRVQRAVVDQLDALDALPPSLKAAEAADMLWTLNHPSVWHLLVRERRWSPTRYEQWLYESFRLQLLGTAHHG